MNTLGWCALAVYLGGLFPAALILYPQAKEDRMVSPHTAAAFFSFLWPLFLAMLLAFAPIWGLGWLVRLVGDDDDDTGPREGGRCAH